MRKLTVLRKNSLVGTKKEVEVYIEDPENPDITLEDIPCRKLGSLSCGEAKHFDIPDRAATVYVLDLFPDIMLCGDKTKLPAGKKDLYLSGKVRMRKNSPFYFDGPATLNAPRYHPFSAHKKLIVTIAVLSCILTPILMGMMPKTEKLDTTLQESAVHEYGEQGLHITLPSNFQKFDMEDYMLTYTTMDSAVYVVKELFSDGEDKSFSQWNLQDYTTYVAAKNHIDPATIQKHKDLFYYTVEVPGAEGHEYLHYVFTYKGSDAFWMLQFAVAKEHAKTFEPSIFQWAESVRVD